MTQKEALDRIREIDGNNSFTVIVEYNPLYMELGPCYKIWLDVYQLSDKKIIECIHLCRKHGFNYTFYDGMSRQAQQEILNYI